MENNQVKVVERPYEVYYRATYQGKVEVRGQEIEFRFSEDNNGSEFYVFNGKNWVESKYDEDSPEWVAYQACLQWNPADFGEPGEIIEIEEDL